jgi:hypothetical protein
VHGALAYERACYDRKRQNWPDYRAAAGAENPGRPTFAVHWCNGAPGIALARLAALQLDVTGQYRNERVLEGITPQRVVVCDPGRRTRQPADEAKRKQLQQTAREANREMLYVTATPEAVVRVDGSEWVVENATKAGARVTYRFSASSHLLLSKESGSRKRLYESWRAVDGVSFPFQITDYYDGQLRFRIQLDSVELAPNLETAWCAEWLRDLE